MKTLLSTILVSVIMLTPCYSFVAPIEFGEKCKRSDAIIRGVVVDIVTVAKPEEDILEGTFTGPSSVAIIRVVSAFKGDSKNIGSIIYVPCGYNFDESPSELTKSKDYILFLGSMGHNYYHPIHPFAIHRVQNELVGMSGFDWDGDFDPKNENREVVSLVDFVKRITDAIKK